MNKKERRAAELAAKEQAQNAVAPVVVNETTNTNPVAPGAVTSPDETPVTEEVTGEFAAVAEKPVLKLAVDDPENPPDVQFVAKQAPKEKKEVPIIPFGSEIRPRIDEVFVKGECDIPAGKITLDVKFDYKLAAERVVLNKVIIATYTLLTAWADRMKGDLLRQGLDVFNHLIENIKSFDKGCPTMAQVAKWAAMKPDKDYFPGVATWSQFITKLDAALGKDVNKFHAIWTLYSAKYRSGLNIGVHYLGDEADKAGVLGDLRLINFNQNEAPMLGVIVAKGYGMLHMVTAYEYLTITSGTMLAPVVSEDFRPVDIEKLQLMYSRSFAYTLENQSMAEGYKERKAKAAADAEYRENEMQGVYDGLLAGVETLAEQLYAKSKDGTLDTEKGLKSDADIVQTLRAYRLITLESKLSKEMRETLNAAIRKYRQPAEDRIKAVEKAAKEAAKEAAEKVKAAAQVAPAKETAEVVETAPTTNSKKRPPEKK